MSIEIQPTLKILGVTLDTDLSFKPHVTIVLKKAYSMIAALRRIKRLVPSDVMILLPSPAGNIEIPSNVAITMRSSRC